MNERFVLPGFMPPAVTKEAERVFSLPNGQIEVVILADQPENDPFPFFEIYLLIGVTDQCAFAFSQSNKFVYDKRKEGGLRDFIARFLPTELNILPGNYLMQVLAGGIEVFKKSLIINDHPTMHARRGPPVETDQSTILDIAAMPQHFAVNGMIVGTVEDPNFAHIVPPIKSFPASYTVAGGGVLWVWDNTAHGVRTTSQTWIPINIQ